MANKFRYTPHPISAYALWHSAQTDSAVTMLARKDEATWNALYLFFDKIDTWYNCVPPHKMTKPAVIKGHAEIGHLMSHIYTSLQLVHDGRTLGHMVLHAEPREVLAWIESWPGGVEALPFFQPAAFLPDYAQKPEIFKKMMEAQTRGTARQQFDLSVRRAANIKPIQLGD